jgi:hypothetical protein
VHNQALTPESDVDLAVDELVTPQDLAQTAPTVLRLGVGVGLTEGEGVIVVRLLRVVVRPHLVHP